MIDSRPDYSSDVSTVAVTGAGGFIGSHLVERLVVDGFKVRALCNYNSIRPRGWLTESTASREVEFLYGDVRDPDIASRLVSGIDVVFHLAARISIPQSYVEPQTYLDVNATGTLNMLRSALRADVASFVQTSTSEVYGTAQTVPIRETHPLVPQSPYAASKVASDALAYSYHRSFDLGVSIVRPFNVFGPRQSVRAIIPTVILQILAGREQIELGNLTPTRDLNFVLDTVRAIESVGLSKDGTGQVLNIASGSEISIGSLADLIQEILGTSLPIVTTEQRSRARSSEVYRLVGSTERYTSIIGPHSNVSLSEALATTVDWFRYKYPSASSAEQALTDPDLATRRPGECGKENGS